MCLAKPLKVISLSPEDATATVDVGGGTLAVGTDLVPGVKTGDWVLVHAGMAIELLEVEDAEALLDAYEHYVTTDALLEPESNDASGE